MSKFKPGQILVCRTVEEKVCVSFYEVIKATTNTCELREIRKAILDQLYDEQEVAPEPGEYISMPFRRKVTQTGAIEISENLYAWPWDGKTQWQAILIYIP